MNYDESRQEQREYQLWYRAWHVASLNGTQNVDELLNDGEKLLGTLEKMCPMRGRP
jgi:hypothetical protein